MDQVGYSDGMSQLTYTEIGEATDNNNNVNARASKTNVIRTNDATVALSRSLLKRLQNARKRTNQRRECAMTANDGRLNGVLVAQRRDDNDNVDDKTHFTGRNGTDSVRQRCAGCLMSLVTIIKPNVTHTHTHAHVHTHAHAATPHRL